MNPKEAEQEDAQVLEIMVHHVGGVADDHSLPQDVHEQGSDQW
jgi:hypothetical protein